MNTKKRSSKASEWAVAIAHGGAPSDYRLRSVCGRAVAAALKVFKGHCKTFNVGSRRCDLSLKSAVAAIVFLEDSGVFNAGSGAKVRKDGGRIEMDAALAGSDGRIGAVANIQGVRNPVLVAERILRCTPHVCLAGAGALEFALNQKLPLRKGFRPNLLCSEFEQTQAETSLVHLTRTKDKQSGVLCSSDLSDGEKRSARKAERRETVSDTVGVCVRDHRGNFAVGVSTGGGPSAMHGRVGDVPFLGAGYFVGPAGAVAATGRGEEIIRRLPSKQIYDWISQGISPQIACERAVELFPKDCSAGFIAIGLDGIGVASNREMAWAEHSVKVPDRD